MGRLLEGEIDELPDLTNAEKIMTDFKLDEEDASAFFKPCRIGFRGFRGFRIIPQQWNIKWKMQGKLGLRMGLHGSFPK